MNRQRMPRASATTNVCMHAYINNLLAQSIESDQPNFDSLIFFLLLRLGLFFSSPKMYMRVELMIALEFWQINAEATEMLCASGASVFFFYNENDLTIINFVIAMSQNNLHLF